MCWPLYPQFQKFIDHILSGTKNTSVIISIPRALRYTQRFLIKLKTNKIHPVSLLFTVIWCQCKKYKPFCPGNINPPGFKVKLLGEKSSSSLQVNTARAPGLIMWSFVWKCHYNNSSKCLMSCQPIYVIENLSNILKNQTLCKKVCSNHLL